MTFEETAEYFKEMTESYGAYELCPCHSDHMDMAEIALSALEKQIPKKVGEYNVIEEENFYNLDFMCPACGNTVIGQPYKPDYCKHCGQALDWGDSE